MQEIKTATKNIEFDVDVTSLRKNVYKTPATRAPSRPTRIKPSNRNEPPEGEMNTQWFKDKLRDKKISQRGLAKILEIDPAAASLMLRDKRKMTAHEGHEISKVLGETFNEVMRQAGVDVIDDVSRVPITSYMDEDGKVSSMAVGTHSSVLGPADCPYGTYAIQVRSPATSKDGWLLFVSPTELPTSDMIDNLCSSATSDGRQLVGTVKRGYRHDTHNLILWPSNAVLSDLSIAWSSPVVWIKP
tara:strand:- start:267 stop:998 length:732 start_codon:yes stop_codon:yes gene_type:complete